MAGIQLPPMQTKGANNASTAESLYDATGQLKIKTLANNNNSNNNNNGMNPKDMTGGNSKNS